MTCPPFCDGCGGNLGHPANGDPLCRKCADRWPPQLLLLSWRGIGRNAWHSRARALGSGPLGRDWVARCGFGKAGTATHWALIDPRKLEPGHCSRAERQRPDFGVLGWGTLREPINCHPEATAEVHLSLHQSAA